MINNLKIYFILLTHYGKRFLHKIQLEIIIFFTIKKLNEFGPGHLFILVEFVEGRVVVGDNFVRVEIHENSLEA